MKEYEREFGENLDFREEIRKLREDVCLHATDTVWVGKGETLVDRISHILDEGDWYNEVWLKDEQQTRTSEQTQGKEPPV
jgi:hypothetical protein